ncbi:hypothetical protein NP493_66g01025 [Ridgeia piscesae]|uniref:Uncharacterized protein n=1 Tax=Ridgeia piscesae TaxID=27915 RepID=A0AAD9P9R1_RIDPI|nr:hypothetical protein NP493_66g01025 [Ridgeia piscesae]
MEAEIVRRYRNRLLMDGRVQIVRFERREASARAVRLSRIAREISRGRPTQRGVAQLRGRCSATAVRAASVTGTAAARVLLEFASACERGHVDILQTESLAMSLVERRQCDTDLVLHVAHCRLAQAQQVRRAQRRRRVVFRRTVR